MSPTKSMPRMAMSAATPAPRNIVVFLLSLAVFVAVAGLLCYGIGKVINSAMNKEDGPNSKWTKTADVRQLGEFPSSPELQNKVATLVEQFPTPRLLSDDGDQDITDLHAREDLLLDHYTRIDGEPGKVRIPIERAMELIAQKGLAGSSGSAATTVDDRRQPAGGDHAAYQRVCPDGIRNGTKARRGSPCGASAEHQVVGQGPRDQGNKESRRE